MCTTCELLRSKIQAAENAGQPEKARVLRAIFDGHRANTCEEGRALVQWKNGCTWAVAWGKP